MGSIIVLTVIANRPNDEENLVPEDGGATPGSPSRTAQVAVEEPKGEVKESEEFVISFRVEKSGKVVEVAADGGETRGEQVRTNVVQLRHGPDRDKEQPRYQANRELLPPRRPPRTRRRASEPRRAPPRPSRNRQASDDEVDSLLAAVDTDPADTDDTDESISASGFELPASLTSRANSNDHA